MITIEGKVPSLTARAARIVGHLPLRVPNYLQVVHYQDRYVLRNGYTRAADLLSQGIQVVPCMLIETSNPVLIGLKPGMFDLETVLSTQPPRLLDFWDDTVTCLWKRPALRYVYRVRADTMPVSRYPRVAQRVLSQ